MEHPMVENDIQILADLNQVLEKAKSLGQSFLAEKLIKSFPELSDPEIISKLQAYCLTRELIKRVIKNEDFEVILKLLDEDQYRIIH
jgi:hypothetical protein